MHNRNVTKVAAVLIALDLSDGAAMAARWRWAVWDLGKR